MTILPLGDALAGIESESMSDLLLAQSGFFAVLAERIGILLWFWHHGGDIKKTSEIGKTAGLARCGKLVYQGGLGMIYLVSSAILSLIHMWLRIASESHVVGAQSRLKRERK